MFQSTEILKLISVPGYGLCSCIFQLIFCCFRIIKLYLILVVIGKRRGPPPEFTWLQPYQQSSSNGPQEKDTVSTASTVAAGDLDSLAPEAASLGDVSVDVAQTSPPPYLHPAVSNAESSSLHVRLLAC